MADQSLRLVRLTSTRTLLPLLEVSSASGRVRKIALDEEQLLNLIGDAAHILAQRRHAQRLNAEVHRARLDGQEAAEGYDGRTTHHAG